MNGVDEGVKIGGALLRDIRFAAKGRCWNKSTNSNRPIFELG